MDDPDEFADIYWRTQARKLYERTLDDTSSNVFANRKGLDIEGSFADVQTVTRLTAQVEAEGVGAAIGGGLAAPSLLTKARFAVLGKVPYRTTKLKDFFKGEHTVSHPWGDPKVFYLDDVARKGFRGRVIDGKLYGAEGSALDTIGGKTIGGTNRAIYVMDEAGEIYISRFQHIGKWHHSSLAGGKPVAGAGEMVIENGKLTFISNVSGHYQPNRFLMVQTLYELRKKGISLDGVVIEFFK